MKRKFYADDLPTQKKLLETVINHIVRLIDGVGCISCRNGQKKLNAGHYHSVGSSKNLRYNLFNIFTQCESCNSYKSSNKTEYDNGLISVYGHEIYEYVKFGIVRQYPLLQIKLDKIRDAIVKAREIEKELVKADRTYNVLERLELRKVFNERIGIYE